MKVLVFGVVKDIVGNSELNIKIKKDYTIEDLQKALILEYPKLTELNKFAFAVNEMYADKSTKIKESDVVAIIPPVSGG